MDKAERENVAAGKKFGGIFKALDELENENRSLWPSLRSYMDEVEKNN